MKGFLAYVIFIIPVLIVAGLAGWQRAQLGTLAGNILLGIEVVAVLAGLVVVRWLRAGRTVAPSVLSLLLASTLFTFVGWVAHPDQIINRADTRVADLELAIAVHQAAQRAGPSEPDADYAERMDRARANLYSARRELEAAEVRYGAFRSSRSEAAVSWIFWLLAAVSGLAAVWLMRMARRKRSNGFGGGVD